SICRGDSFGSVVEHCHHPVPEGFHHCATTVGYGFITRRTDVVQQLQHLLVACLQGPLGERDEVGEHDGAFPFTGLPPTSATGGRMPDLHTGEPEFAGHTGAFPSRRSDQLCDTFDPALVSRPIPGCHAASGNVPTNRTNRPHRGT